MDKGVGKHQKVRSGTAKTEIWSQELSRGKDRWPERELYSSSEYAFLSADAGCTPLELIARSL
jgi:hypothetical protein